MPDRDFPETRINHVTRPSSKIKHIADTISEIQSALLDELEYRHGGDRLADTRNPKQRRRLDRDVIFGRSVGVAALEEDGLIRSLSPLPGAGGRLRVDGRVVARIRIAQNGYNPGKGWL